MKTILILGLTLAVLSLITLTSIKKYEATQSKESSNVEDWKERNTLKWHVKKAKERGERQVVLPAPNVEYVTNIKDLDEALKFYSVIIAEPLEKKSYAQDRMVITWYKFKVVENLSPKPLRECSVCPAPNDVPAEMASLNSDEILVAKNGGTVTIEGVPVTMEDLEFPDFEFSKKYLLFLEMNASGQLGKIMVGPDATFTVNPDESLTPINNKAHSLKNIMKAQLKNSVHNLRETIHKRAALQ